MPDMSMPVERPMVRMFVSWHATVRVDESAVTSERVGETEPHEVMSEEDTSRENCAPSAESQPRSPHGMAGAPPVGSGLSSESAASVSWSRAGASALAMNAEPSRALRMSSVCLSLRRSYLEPATRGLPFFGESATDADLNGSLEATDWAVLLPFELGKGDRNRHPVHQDGPAACADT